MRKLMVKLTSLLAAVAFCSASGAHWVMLQSVAWVGMVVTFAQDRSLTEALSDTLGGQHPCDMCKAIESGKKQEKESQPNATRGAAGKVLLYFLPQNEGISPDGQRCDMGEVAESGKARRDAPLLPPPRWG